DDGGVAPPKEGRNGSHQAVAPHRGGGRFNRGDARVRAHPAARALSRVRRPASALRRAECAQRSFECRVRDRRPVGPRGGSRSPRADRLAFGLAILLYALAKVFELRDQATLDVLGLMSGHTMKHLLATLAGAVLTWNVVRGRTSTRPVVRNFIEAEGGVQC